MKTWIFRTVSWAVVSLVILLGLSTSACSKRYHNLPAFWGIEFRDAENYSVGRFKTTYLADQIHAYFRGSARGPIAIATFVDIDDLYGSSTFGRIISEQLMSELAMRGYNVLEIRQSDALQVLAEEGEFGLSREIENLRNTQNISGLVVGTYAASPLRIYINTRLIDPSTSLIMSVGSVEMERTEEISRLLRNNSFPRSLERIPVRQFGSSTYPFPTYWPFRWYSLVPPERDIYPDQFGMERDMSGAGHSDASKGQQKKDQPPQPSLEPAS